MRLLTLIFVAICLVFTLSCKKKEKDMGLLPNLSFKTGGTYLSSDDTLPGGTTVTMGINASKSEGKDYLKQFTITRAINGGSNNSVYSKTLSDSEGESFSYDFVTIMDTIHGQSNKYLFSITNRDGLTNQISITLVVQ